MERYNEYKDSGELWLGEIPSHWEVKRLKACFTERNEQYSRNESLGILSVMKGIGVIPYEDKGNVGNNAKEDKTQYKVARKGDLVINSMNVIIGSLGISPKDGYISPAYYAFSPRTGIDERYYSYVLSLNSAQKNIRRFSKGIMEIRLKISSSDFLSIPFPVPPTSEQQAIATYLDTATAKIDEAIAQQQKMIDLLNERKQIVINNAVTKGLNPDAPMKDSGVDWIGEIPEHWEALRIRYIGEAKNGLTYSPNDMVDEGNGILVLRSSNIQDGKLAFEDNVYVKGAPEKLWVKKGDIIICSRNGSASLVGKCAIVEEDIYASLGAFMMRFRSEHNSKYTYYLLTAAISHYKQLFATSTINQLTLGIFADIKMPFVYDLQEQTKIAESLDLAIKKLDTAISNATKQISLLQERKQIIINDVVTGKVKVC